jgi:hypothetical protein
MSLCCLLLSTTLILRSWDDWVPEAGVHKDSEENQKKHAEQQNAQQVKAKLKSGGKNGSEFGSIRGSEERPPPNSTAAGRGTKRTRDYDLQQVRLHFIALALILCNSFVVWLSQPRAFDVCVRTTSLFSATLPSWAPQPTAAF